MNEHLAGKDPADDDHQHAPATTAGVPVGVHGGQLVPPASRHEVVPTVQCAISPGPARDTFLFYHVAASSKDINGLWDSCRFCVSNLIWVNDHFLVTPNPCYLNPSSGLAERFAKITHVLLNWYDAKRLIASLDWPAE